MHVTAALPGRPARALAAGLLAASVALGPAACTVSDEDRSTTEVAAGLESAGEEASSAVATARLAFVQLRDGKTFRATADIAQSDSILVLETATRALTTLVAPDAAIDAARDALLDAVQQATSSVVATRAWITTPGTASADDVLADLENASDALDAAIAGAGAS